ncbi:hypothetical protein HELRODRAFT_112321 [Helobdella robusta]|uniref:DNA-directed RNA polymerase I subunit RPA1 n=1 Tax=Helobdella robusta TaxID=6412 RepID=T1EFI6_HELRO|nr:hypothetical protein HELRODRAFT_112321 [Helobdella robusta]ESO03447.1 hypothetical protein HELRODRAFT_112321 [Helobdella robusta]
MKKTTAEDLHRAWFVLQTRVNAHLDQGLCRIFKDSLPGVKQTIEKKEGLLRKNMMGKRVNSAARSVISPDPYLDCNQVGIPVEFAKRLMFSEVVHPRNFEELREAVINGPDEYPGAYSVQLENDQLISLHAKTRAQREAIANQLLTPTIINGYPSTDKKKVKRHLKTGDKMILNRQPTLHKPSMQTFSARVLPMEKTIRINYTPCKAFNADFDGDEMNAHFPQNEVARAEAFVVACAEEQYLVPKDGKPIAGLIQDHMVSGVLLTVRGRFFHRMQYQQLVYAALSNSQANIKLLPPSVYRPVCLWSGKQVLSTLLLNVIPDDKPALSLKGKSKISDQVRKKLMEQVENKLDPSYPFMSESDVLIVDGELLQGVLDKNHYGASAYGLVHWCYELYGGEVSSRLLTCLGRLFTYFLRSQHSFTMGVEDIIITEQGDKERIKKIKEVKECGQEVVARAMQLPAWADPQQIVDGLKRVQFSKKRMDLLELDGAINTQMTQFQDKIKKSCWPQNLIKSFPSNNLTLMVQSGAKGSVVSLILSYDTCARATLPSFKPYDLHPRAGGFIDNRFLTGLNVQEYFFHCMAGRDGLVDTAVKTSRSGYLQRCLIKHLEGLTSAYDETVRDSDGSIIQFKYGEDGLDVMRTSFLEKKHFSQLIENQYSIVNKELEAEIFSKINTVDALQHHLKMEEWRSTHENFTRKTAFQLFSERHWDEVRERMMMMRRVQMDGANQAFIERQLDEICKEELSNMFDNMNDKQSRRLQKKLMTCPDPVSSILPASRYLGCTSQHFHDVLEEYIKRDDNKVSAMRHPYKITTDDLKKMMYLKYQRSLIQPGEAVGILAATSMGEQTTQMTLNTFHFAGHGAMNVTLGIPRLREILMVASKDIKTPMMMVPLLSLGDKAERRVNKFIKKFRRVPLEKVLSSAVVKKTLIVSEFKKGHRLYKIRFNVAPHSLYKDDFNLNPAKILNYLESKFMGHLARVIEKQERELVASSDDDDDDDDAAAADDSGDDGERKRRADQDADEEEDDEAGDDDDDDGNDEGSGDDDGDEDGEEDGKEKADENSKKKKPTKNRSKNNEDDDDDDDDDDNNNKNNNNNDEGGDNDDEMTEKKKTKRRKAVCSKSHVIDYVYDVQDNMWGEVTFKFELAKKEMDIQWLVDSEIKRTVINQVANISNCIMKEIDINDSPAYMFESALNELERMTSRGLLCGRRKKLQVEGLNIQEMYKYQDRLCVDELYCNNIQAIALNYGIEAASQVIIEEIRQVFKAYGIDVDYRHLSLIADYMTYEGSFRPFNRLGLDSNASTLQKMSFESALNYLKKSIVDGSHENAESPSACLILGKPIKTGTGSFDLVVPVS